MTALRLDEEELGDEELGILASTATEAAEELEAEDGRLMRLFLRQPPPTGTLRRVPPRVQ